MSIRDLRQKWPEAESALETESEIIITRDSRPVARLVRITSRAEERPRFDPAGHKKWQAKVGGRRVSSWVDKSLAEAREDRKF